MDAISFVLGVKSANLRSSALKDLIYRSGRRRGDRKGKRKAEMEADEQDDVESEEEGESEEEDDEAMDGERTAWVMAVYIDQEDKEWTFQRSISIAGTSEYKLNNQVVTWKRYNATLERFNILVKAKNFLVFQVSSLLVASGARPQADLPADLILCLVFRATSNKSRLSHQRIWQS
jgi:structural maintenance of chromosome 1